MTAAKTTAPTAAASDTRTQLKRSCAIRCDVPRVRDLNAGQMPQPWVDGPQIATVTTIAIAAISTVAAVNRPKAANCSRWCIQGSRRSR